MYTLSVGVLDVLNSAVCDGFTTPVAGTEREVTGTSPTQSLLSSMRITNQAGTPTEEPERFVCMNCRVISAGIPMEGGPDSDHDEPPVECGACGRDDFVEFAQFHRAYTRRT